MNEEEEVEEKAAISREVWISVDSVTLPGELSVPDRAEGLVLFAHGSGSGRHSPRNQLLKSRQEERRKVEPAPPAPARKGGERKPATERKPASGRKP